MESPRASIAMCKVKGRPIAHVTSGTEQVTRFDFVSIVQGTVPIKQEQEFCSPSIGTEELTLVLNSADCSDALQT